MPVGLPLANSGRARALGVTSRQRYPAAPNVPTIASKACPNTRRRCGTACSRRRRFRPNSRRVSRATLRRPQAARDARNAGENRRRALRDNQANFKKFFHADIEKWKNLVKATNLKLE